MLRRGEVVALERTSTLLQRFAGMQLSLRFSQGVLPVELRALAVDPRAASGTNHLLRLASYEDVEPILAKCRAAGCTLDEVAVRKADRKGVFGRVMNEPEVIEGLS